MRNKKPRKSLFTWCIRTLAVSLVPSLLLISCASSDSSGTPDTTAPTVSFGTPDTTVVGSVTYTLTFSEAVTGVASTGSASNVTLVDNTSTSLPVTVTPNAASTIWTVDPDGSLSTGTYTINVATTGIKDAAGNTLDNGTSLSFTVADAHSTVLNELQTDLTTDQIGTGLITSIINDVTGDTSSLSGTGNDNNTLANVVPAALGSALDAIEAYPNLSENIEAAAIESVFNSVMGTVTTANLNTKSYRSTAAVDSGFTSLFGSIATLIGEKIPSAAAMEKVMGAFVKSLSKAGVTDSAEIGSYVTTISTKATTALINRVDETLDKNALLAGISTGMATGAAAVSADLVATVNSATATGMTAGVAASNNTGYDIDTLKPDVDPPTITISSPTNNSTTNSSTVTVNTAYSDGKGADDNVSVSIVATSGTTTIDTKTLAAGATSANFVLTDGTYTITANATDQALNSGSASATITVDATAPVISITSPSSGAYVTATPTVTGTATDGGTGITSVTIGTTTLTVTDGAFSGAIAALSAGAQTITVTGLDGAGNYADNKSVSVTVDASNPALTTATLMGYVSGADNSTYTDNGTVKVTLAYSDDTAVSSWSWSSDKGESANGLAVDNSSDTVAYISLTAQGTHTITLKVFDQAGNDNSSTDNITVDTSGPVSNGSTLSLNDNDTYGSNTTYANDITGILVDNVSGYATDAGIGITHYLFTDNSSKVPTSTDGDWFSKDNITTTHTFSTNSGDNATIVSGDTLTLRLWAKDGFGQVSSDAVASGSITLDNVSPTNDNASTTVSGATYVASSSRYTVLSTSVTFDPKYSDALSGVLGYYLTDNYSYTPVLADFDNSTLTKTGLTKNTNKVFTLHVLDNAYNLTSDNFTIYPDFQANPSLQIDNATTFYGGATVTGGDNGTIAQISGSTAGADVSITFSVSGANGGYQGYAIVLDNDTNLDSYMLDPSSLTYTNSLTYTFNDGGFANDDTLGFFIFGLTNSGKYTYGGDESNTILPFTVVLNTELGLNTDNSTRYKIAVSDFTVEGYDNASATAKDNGTSVIAPTAATINFTATSTLTPVNSFALACENSVAYFALASSYTTYAASDYAKGDGNTYSDNYTISGLNLSSLFGTDCEAEGSHTLYIAAKTDGGLMSVVASDAYFVDSTKPTVDNLTLHKSDNSSHTDNVTDTTVGFTVYYNDLNSSSENGTLVTHYLVSETDISSSLLDNTSVVTSAGGVGNSAWTAVDNASSSDDTYTFAENPALTSRTLYVWVKDNASNISLAGSDSINILKDTTPPRVDNVTMNPGVSSSWVNSQTVAVRIGATDNDSGVQYWHINEDNATPSGDNDSLWTAFSSPSSSVYDNVTYTFDNDSNVSKTVYVFVKNSQDNVSVSSSGTITLDNTAPVDNKTSAANLLRGAIDGTDNYTYTDNLTVRLDNLTNWFNDNSSGVASVSGVYSYYITDNSSRSKDNVTNSSGWQTLDNLTFTIGGAWGGYTLDNNSQGLKQFYVWVQDNASNVSDNHTEVSITFDNLTPYVSTFSLLDQTDNTSSFTNSQTINVRLESYDNDTNGTGSNNTHYFLTDNASYASTAPSLTDTASGDNGWVALGDDNYTATTFTFDNSTNETKTLYVYVRDAAGQLSTVASQSIVFDNRTPTDLTVADNGSKGLFGADNYLDNITFVISVNDNGTPAFDNASGFKDFFIRYEGQTNSVPITNAGTFGQYTDVTDATIASQATGWIPFSSLITSGSDNTSRSVSNALYTLDLSNVTVTKVIAGTTDNGTVDNGSIITSMVVWFRDNASNISGNYTVSSFTLDNNTD